MDWFSRAGSVPPQHLRRLRLRRAATRYAAHGWDVVPGACLVGTRFDCGQPGCHAVACHPALPDWTAAATHDVALVRSWWRHSHVSVLLATGRAFDALEVPAALGRFAMPRLDGPVAVAPSGRWLLLVRPGSGLRRELRYRRDVVLHGPDSWIAAPPTPFPTGRMRWAAPPERVGWRLPEPFAVQTLLLAGVRLLEPPVPAARRPSRPLHWAA